MTNRADRELELARLSVLELASMAARLEEQLQTAEQQRDLLQRESDYIREQHDIWQAVAKKHADERVRLEEQYEGVKSLLESKQVEVDEITELWKSETDRADDLATSNRINQDALASTKEQLESLRSGGAGLIAAERQRQVRSEGWTPDHDDEWDDGELARAAVRYAMEEVDREHYGYSWPWAWEWWKPSPKDRVRELVKAGALIAAEIDRLQRAASSPAFCAGE